MIEELHIRAPDMEIVSLFEELLKRAKEGQIVEACVTTRNAENTISTAECGGKTDVFRMLGAMQHAVTEYQLLYIATGHNLE